MALFLYETLWKPQHMFHRSKCTPRLYVYTAFLITNGLLLQYNAQTSRLEKHPSPCLYDRYNCLSKLEYTRILWQEVVNYWASLNDRFLNLPRLHLLT